ncbi:hypothetical protein HPB49_015478 [Dermacentor silvarum]|uniref:Uncharacterized protein n=1 Tax=Dermacentor silvarum TaxID=543639 RepID=A0ACB8E0S1_DERSI|nr:hypothetical protein HPB49_015478 [Dermacentor silvarum]
MMSVPVAANNAPEAKSAVASAPRSCVERRSSRAEAEQEEEDGGAPRGRRVRSAAAGASEPHAPVGTSRQARSAAVARRSALRAHHGRAFRYGATMTSLPGMTHDPSAPPPLLLDSPYVSPDYGNLSLLPSLPAGNVSSGKLYQVPVGFIVLLSIFYGLISLVAVAGNFMVMWIVATSRRMQTVTNFFIANLAVADIIIGLFSIPFQFQAALLQRWVLPEFMCAFCPFVQVLSVNVSIFTLTAIALDRYRAVMSPLKARTTKLRAKFIICGIWTLAVAAALPCALALRVETQVESHALNLTKPFCHEVGISRKAWRIYNHVLVCLQYFFPLLTICFVYARMGLKLKESKSPGNAQGARDAGILKNKKKVRTHGSVMSPHTTLFGASLCSSNSHAHSGAHSEARALPFCL